MSQPIVFIDLDYTLFKTQDFSLVLAALVADRTGSSQEDFMAALRKDTYYIKSEGLGYYDFYAHADSLGIPRDEITQIVRDNINGDDFLFEDVAAFMGMVSSLSAEPVILTYGDDRFQRLKAGLCRSLAGIPVRTVVEPKARFIRTFYPDREGFLIDDKPDQNLPSGFIEITIDRSESRGLTPKPGGYVVNTLQEAADLIG